jgi:4-hydroxy-3-methylbut-2-enyl diphosphate reductase
VALSWAVVLTFLPHAASGTIGVHIETVACFLWIFFLSYLRSLLFDMRDIEGDRIMGRETLVTIIGEKKADKLMLVLIQSLGAAAVAYTLITLLIYRSLGSTTVAYALQLPVLLYTLFFTKKLKRRNFRHGSVFNLLADAPFFLAGALAYVAHTLG